MTKLFLDPGTLVFFIDESGDDRFGDRNHPVFVIGGCSVLGVEYELICQEWRKVRLTANGDDQSPLHASALDISNQEAINAVASFFENIPFGRFAVGLSHSTTIFDLSKIRSNVLDISLKCMWNRQADIAKWRPFSDIAVVFEASHRDTAIQSTMQSFHPTLDSVPVPWEAYFLEKKYGDCALEISDFIVHAAAGQVKRHISGQSGFRRDFQSIFHKIDSRLVSFMHISNIELNDSNNNI